jgi:nucleotide-binding universal stress UspA family protein
MTLRADDRLHPARTNEAMTETQPMQAQDGRGAAKPGPVFADILCAVDGTRRSYTAVEQAAALAGSGGQLTLLAVTAVAGSGAFRSARINSARVKRVLHHAERKARDAGVKSNAVVDPGGPPSTVILQAAAQHDLLALGAPAMSPLGAMLVGGVAFETLQSFTTPLLMARPAPPGVPFAGRMLVASDALEGSDGLVELAGRLARERGASVILLHADGVEPGSAPRSIQAQAQALESVLAGKSETRVEPGGAQDVIVDVATSEAVSLIVMGSRRRGGLLALGSVSRRVVHDAPCSVLLVPPEDLPG